LHEAGRRARHHDPSAGTDGRDGPTDAAGAIVDGHTWSRIALADRDPQRDLDAHDAYPRSTPPGAAAHRMTGTNVNDVVIALLE
jgi:glycerate-2-kinase